MRIINKRGLRHSDLICERHFEPEQILTNWEHIIDGKVVSLKREKPKLKSDAVPLRNLHVESPAPYSPEQRPTRTRNARSDNKRRKTKERNGGARKDIDHDIEMADSTAAPEAELNSLSVEEEGSDKADAARTEERLKMFESLHDDIYEVVLPSTLWGIHRDPDHEFIAFSMFDAKRMSHTKTVFIDKTLRVQTYLNGTILLDESFEELNTEIVTQILTDIDEHDTAEK